MYSRTNDQPRLSHHHHDRSADHIRSMHDIFSNPFRCAVLNCLQERDEPADVDELVQHVLSLCAEEEDGAPSPDVHHSTESWLFNEHIIRMDEFGVVSYDPREETVRLAEDVSLTLPQIWTGTEPGRV